MPPKLADDYERALSDPTLAHYREALALQDALIQEVLNEYGEGGGKAWCQVTVGWRRLVSAQEGGDRARVAEAMELRDRAITAGSRHSAKRAEIFGLLDKRCKLANSETRRGLAEAQIYSIEQVTALACALGHLADRYLAEDKKVAFFNEYAAIVRGDPAAPEPPTLDAPKTD